MNAEQQTREHSKRSFSIRQLAFVMAGIAVSIALIRIAYSAGSLFLIPFTFLPGTLGLFVFTVAPVGYCVSGTRGKKVGIRLAIALWLLFLLVGLLLPSVEQH